jgi:hypothetical protein
MLQHRAAVATLTPQRRGAAPISAALAIRGTFGSRGLGGATRRRSRHGEETAPVDRIGTWPTLGCTKSTLNRGHNSAGMLRKIGGVLPVTRRRTPNSGVNGLCWGLLPLPGANHHHFHSITAARPTTRRQPREIVATVWNMLVAFSKKARKASMSGTSRTSANGATLRPRARAKVCR